MILVPYDKDNAYIIEFKVQKTQKEKVLEKTVANLLSRIEEKQYAASLIADGAAPENIRKYGFEGKRCLIG